MKRHLPWVATTAAVVLCDQVSKLAAGAWLGGGETIPVIPMLDFALAHNRGAAFSFLSDAGGWQRWFLTVLSAVVSVIIAVWITRLEPGERLTRVSLALILGGAVGNIVDRVAYGYVIDFIDFYYPAAGRCIPLFHRAVDGACHFPTFNIADSAITVGATLLIAASLFPGARDTGGR